MRAVLVVLAACGSTANVPGERAPAIAVAEIARDTLCVTHGSLGSQHITEPTVRAFARNSRGDAASLAFRYLGPTATVRELASGQARHQVGLKLRAQDGCNVVYVMWRSDKAKLDVSVKVNPNEHTHEQCGADGYTKVHGISSPIPDLGGTHTLRAEVVGDDLTAWIDDRVAWSGTLPSVARSLVGPSGFRTDNVELELRQFAAPIERGTNQTCPHEPSTSSDE